MRNETESFNVIKFAGLTLGGGKGRKTCLCILEYYVKQNRLFLSEFHENIEEKPRLTADTQIIKIFDKIKKNLAVVGIDAPLKSPKCMRCKLTCPGLEKCEEPEIKWMWKWHKKRSPQKRPNKIFTPYTERCVEQYVSTEIDAPIYPDHAFGSNKGPLTARALFLKRRMGKTNTIEVMPKLSTWVLGHEIGLRPSQILFYKNSTDGSVVRQNFLNLWNEKEKSFIYQKDFKIMVKDVFAFEAFICAYTAFLSSKQLCEPRPKGFPKNEAWIAFPKLDGIVK